VRDQQDEDELEHAARHEADDRERTGPSHGANPARIPPFFRAPKIHDLRDVLLGSALDRAASFETDLQPAKQTLLCGERMPQPSFGQDPPAPAPGIAASGGRAVLAEIDAVSPARVLLTSKELGADDDVDLICRRGERLAIGGFLTAAGFRRRPAVLGARAFTEQWVRFAGGAPTVVDLNPAERWGLPAAEREALFADAVPVEGFRSVALPAPHHAILLASRRLVAGRALSERRKAQLERRLAEDPQAWEKAAAHAPAWCCTRGVTLLRRWWQTGLPPSRRDLVLARLELARSFRNDGTRRLAGLARARTARLRPATIVAFSGLDGAGKSTQVTQLSETLRHLGVDSRVVWKPMGHSGALRFVRRRLKRALGVGVGPASHRPAADAPARHWDPEPRTKSLRERIPLATQLWAAFVGVSAAAYYRRAQLRHAGHVLVFDRHLLDTRAQLRFFYGARSRLGLALGLVDLLCPRADRAYFLDVPPEDAHRRKPLQYDTAELDRQAALYREEAARLRACRLDATQPAEILSAFVAADLWSSLC
jgi:thymidylate kinase